MATGTADSEMTVAPSDNTGVFANFSTKLFSLSISFFKLDSTFSTSSQFFVFRLYYGSIAGPFVLIFLFIAAADQRKKDQHQQDLFHLLSDP